ncbi:hypothetical protein Tco_1334796 [Tanacetum coccineum]
MSAPDQPQDHLSSPPRPPTSDPFTSTNVEDEPLGGSFHAFPPRSTQASPAGHTSGGAEDPITLTALSSVDVVGKLVKKVKAMKVKLKTKKRKVIVSDSDQEEGREQAMDLDALIALANTAVTVDSNVSLEAAKSFTVGWCFDKEDETRHLAENLAKERWKGNDSGQQRTYMRQFVKNQSSALYSTGWTKANVEIFTDAKLKEEFEKIQKALANNQVQAFSRTLKRTGPELEEPSSKQQKSTEAPIPSVVFDEDSTDEAPILWSALAGWEVISIPLGEINALYRSDQSTKHFTTLREILHIVDRQDLLKLYGMVVTYYENHPVAGAGLMLWGEVLYMFTDVSYPLSVKLMERMLKHKLEIDKDVVGNDMNTAEQLIRFIKNQFVVAQVSPV